MFIGTIDGIPRRSSSSVDADAKQLSQSLEKFWSFTSNVILKETKLKCQSLSKCCSGKDYSKALALMAVNFSIDPFPVIFSACLGSLNPAHIAKTCPMAAKLKTPLKFEPDSISEEDKSNPMAMLIVNNGLVINNFTKNMPRDCNQNEVNAYLCLSNKKLIQSCVKKIQQKQFDYQGAKTYKESTKKLKDALNSINKVLQQMKLMMAISS